MNVGQLSHMHMQVSHSDMHLHHQLADLENGQVPAFLTKTFDIVSDPSTDHIISWSSQGNSFVIHDTGEFLADIIPKNFKHNNFASFVRQLNIYGFQKVGNKHVCEFRHEYFQAKGRHLLAQIKRKAPSKRMSMHDDPMSSRNEAIVTELLQLKQRQDLLEMNLVQAMNTNDSLWNDLVACKQQQREIQDNLQKTLYFLMTVYSNEEEGKQAQDLHQSQGGGPSGPGMSEHEHVSAEHPTH